MKARAIPFASIHWNPCWRIVPCRWPSINLFERIADPADWESLIELEAMTNDRIRDETGVISLVPVEDRVSGPGSSYIMAPFTHVNPMGSRFSDGTFGVFYAGKELLTAVEETVYHRERFLAFTSEPAADLQMTVLEVEVHSNLHDIRKGFSKAHDPNRYTYSRDIGVRLREKNSYGIVYNSVRHSGGECVGVFRPSAVKSCCYAKHYLYRWDGSKITVWDQVN